MGVVDNVDRCNIGKNELSIKIGCRRGRRNIRFPRNTRNNLRGIRDRLSRARRETTPIETVPDIGNDGNEQEPLSVELDEEIEVQFCRSRPSKKLLYIDCICKPSHCNVEFFSPSGDLLIS